MGLELQLHSLLTSAIYGDKWSTSRHGRFNPGEEFRYSLNRRLGGPHARTGRFREEKTLLVLTGVPTLDCPARSIVAVPTTLVKYYIIFCELLNSYSHRQFSEITLSPVFRFGIISEEVTVGVHLRPVQQSPDCTALNDR